MLNAYGTANGCLTEFASSTSPVVPPDSVWLDLVEPTAEEEAAVESFLGIDIPTREELAEIEASSRLYQDDGAAFMTATLIRRGDKAFAIFNVVGTANNIATARGISVESVKHAGIVESQAGKVRVLRRDELDDKWEPGTDQHLTIWECLQHLVRLHEKDGISYSTAVLLKKIGDKAEAVKDLSHDVSLLFEKLDQRAG